MQKTHIQWTDATVNFWTGCEKVSPGCKYCYMYRDKERYGKDPSEVIRTNDTTFYQALKWKEPRLIFTCSWSDFFISQADQWRDDAWKVIKNTTQHQWQVLTKRPERILQCLPKDWGEKGYANVWLGVSIENQTVADERLRLLKEVPAVVRFLSVEPLIGAVTFKEGDLDGIHWVIIGGESGNDKGKYKYRPSQLEWITAIAAQCKAAGVPVFVKQIGTALSKELKLQDRHGGMMEEWPKEIQVREFPSVIKVDPLSAFFE